jgi:carboxypeptidase family protein
MHDCDERSVVKAIRLMSAVILLLATAGFSPRMGGILHAATSSGAALTGQVSSAEEGPMEGVPVSARRDGSTITVSVTTDKQGRYTFPRNRLDPGHYALRIRAIGYGLSGAASADITADKTAAVDLTLKKVQDISSQLTNTEWLLSMPGANGISTGWGNAATAIHTSES